VIERRIEFVVLSSVLREIEMIAHDSTKVGEQRSFKLALELAKRCKIVEYDSGENLSVDDQILAYTSSIDGVLATNDRKLREKARKQGVPVLRLRGKKTLSLEGASF
jgi:rRNA-processing protein FCF1